jgi:hypothetical protein
MLVEALVAMGILVVAVFAVYSLLTRSTSLNRVVSQQYVATYLASEGLELVKNITDSNLMRCGLAWNYGATDGTYEVAYDDMTLFRSASGNKLRIDPQSGFYQYAVGSSTPYSRTVIIETIAADKEIRATSVVEWRGRGGVESEVRLEDHFFKWRPAPSGC